MHVWNRCCLKAASSLWSLCTAQDCHRMGKIPQLPNVHAGQDGGHSVFGPHPEGGLPVPLLSPRRLRTSGHHHRCQVGFVDLLIIIDQGLPLFLKYLVKYPPSYYSVQQRCIEGTATDDKSLNEHLISLACHQFSFLLKIFIASGGPVRSSFQNQAPKMFLEIHHQEELLVEVNLVLKSCKTV